MNTDFEEKIILAHIKEYLKEGVTHFKSRDIANDIGYPLTSNKVGQILHILSKKENLKIKIFVHAQSGSRSTWKAEVI